MKKLLSFLAVLLIPVAAIADDTSWNGPLPMGNDKWLSSRSPSTQTEIDLVRLSPDGDTEINAQSGKTIKLMVNKTSELALSNDLIALSGTTSTVQSAGGLVLKPDADAQRIWTFDASSDTALTLVFGDGSTTAAQVASIRAGSADADDDATLCLSGSGSCTGGAANNARGGFINLMGADVGGANSGYTEIGGTGRIDFFTGSAGTNALRLTDTGHMQAAGDLIFTTSGGTISLQEATAANTCMGTITANGTTAVTTNTTCALTGSRIFLTRSSAPSGTAQCWWDTLVNGVSFNLDCDGGETGTFNYFIINESA